MPKPDTAAKPDPKSSWLVLAAHGSATTRPGTSPTAELARTLAARKVFAGVSYGFLEAQPSLVEAVDAAGVTDIVIVPNLACAGYVATAKLPAALGLTGAKTERITRKGRQRLYLAAPVGTDAGVPKLVAGLFRDAMDRAALASITTTAVVVGHGSSQRRASFEQTNQIARLAALEGLRTPVLALFLDEPPFVSDWAKTVSGDNIVFLPAMISDGNHGTGDIPEAIGLEVTANFTATLNENGLVGPTTLQGRQVYFVAPLGRADGMADIVIGLATAALGG